MDSVKMLPDAYVKSSSNIGKLLSILDHGFDMLDDTLNGVISIQDLNTAAGTALDYYAASEGFTRGGLSDDELRFKIQLQIAVDSSSGTAEDILTLFSSFLKLPPGKLSISEGNRMITINGLTLDDLGNVNYPPDQINKFVGRLASAGIGVTDIIFAKTAVLQIISETNIYETSYPQTGVYQSGQRMPW